MPDLRHNCWFPRHLGCGIAAIWLMGLAGCTTIADRLGTIDVVTIDPIERIVGQDINEASDRVFDTVTSPRFWRGVGRTGQAAGALAYAGGKEFVRVARQPVRDPNLYDHGSDDAIDDYDTYLLQDMADGP